MGNNCVAGGPTPHLVVVNINNETALTLRLDQQYRCTTINRHCKGAHRGFSAKHGKFVDGSLPATLEPSQRMQFRISGRAGSGVCPYAQVVYVATNPEDRASTLRFDITIEASGWTSFQDSVVIMTKVEGTLADSVEVNHNGSWISNITIGPKKDRVMNASLTSRFGEFNAEVGRDDVQATVEGAAEHVDLILDRRINQAIAQADGSLDTRIQQLEMSMGEQVDHIGTTLGAERRLWSRVLLRWAILIAMLVVAVHVSWGSLIGSLILFGVLAILWILCSFC
eukprot:NODE_3721_length_1170_cov_140.560649_g3536_i0.p1 GENE.NODE_3721_length_1170_cov_140.560649_g3536_i0~~NODE_3721_length_1170_cov_140.560649_g3536_i0.p1  ORF type:complete len:282 (+),score=19.26 NODE_3721_length_1170_cov_140.560649_g3536_i0:81-926(+)